METQTATADASVNEELIWKAHIVDAERFEGTLSDYCATHGLTVRQFHRYRKKFGITRSYRRRRSKAFVKVECPETPVPGPKKPEGTSGIGLPDPKWLADFILALTSRQ